MDTVNKHRTNLITDLQNTVETEAKALTTKISITFKDELTRLHRRKADAQVDRFVDNIRKLRNEYDRDRDEAKENLNRPQPSYKPQTFDQPRQNVYSRLDPQIGVGHHGAGVEWITGQSHTVDVTKVMNC